MSAELGLGKLITTPQKRDAIHVAIAPAVAGKTIAPGDHVGIGADGRMYPNGNGIGVADPFLTEYVNEGEQFWLFLYPNTVTSLRHEWTHPAFSDSPPKQESTSSSEAWLRRYAHECDMDYDEMIDRAGEYLDHGEYWCEGGRFEGLPFDKEFWLHFQSVTGKDAKGEDCQFFTCTC